MKPTIHNESQNRSDTRRQFPITDFNYGALDVSDCNARCAELSGNSFRSTREYFAHEANREFLTEAAVFGAIMLSIAVPLFNGILAIVDLIRSGGAA
jgi:hypothetical protein